MRLLLIADHEETGLWDYWNASKTKDVDLILSAGDLSPKYLEFLTTMVNRPLLYVRGNHDGVYDSDEPLGCTGIDDRIYIYKGLRILGLGGSYRYGSRKDMYTEGEMKKRIRALKHALQATGGIDILLTHAPAQGYGDLEDLAHRGFECFNHLLATYHPLYMVHGHVHKNYGGFERERIHDSGVRILNAYGAYMIDIPDDELHKAQKPGFLTRYRTRRNIIWDR